MEKTEIIVGDLKVKRVDSMNWQVFERREIKESRNPNGGKSRAGEVDWVALPAFFGTLKPAVMRARVIHRERGLDAGDLDGAVKQLGRLDAEFEKKLDEALKAVAP